MFKSRCLQIVSDSIDFHIRRSGDIDLLQPIQLLRQTSKKKTLKRELKPRKRREEKRQKNNFN